MTIAHGLLDSPSTIVAESFICKMSSVSIPMEKWLKTSSVNPSEGSLGRLLRQAIYFPLATSCSEVEMVRESYSLN